MASRRSRYSAKKSKQQLVLTLGGIILLILFVLFFAGSIIEFIGNAVFLIKGEGKEQSEKSSETLLVAPELDQIDEYVSDESLTVSGSASSNQGKVEIYLNGDLVSKSDIDEKGDFSQVITLSEGENLIRVRHVSGTEIKSKYSSDRVHYITQVPDLEIFSPSDGANFSQGDQRIKISGMSDAGSVVKINGFRAVSGQDGSFSYFLQLNEGENKIMVESANKAGLVSEKEISVFFSP